MSVTTVMTPKRRRYRETEEFVGMVRRVVRRLGVRVGGDVDRGQAPDIAMLKELADVSRELDEIVAKAVTALSDAGYSWSEIGEQLGRSKQSAHRRYSR